MLSASGVEVALRSQDEMPTGTTEIYVADTMGELGLFYRIAPVAFMGGSLVERGGQNPIEAIKLGAAVLHGPYVFNFAEIYEALDEAGGALHVDNEEDFVKSLGYLLANPIGRQRATLAAEQVVERLGGGLEKTLAALEPYLLQLLLEGEGIDA
jgi:3-deoxy-D-manno-octulosonic-acid transferase